MRIYEETRNNQSMFARVRRNFFFILIGIFLIAVGVFVTSIYADSKDWIRTEATIIKTYEESETLVEYTVDGEKYGVWLSQYSSGYEPGDTLKIRYNPENPSEATAPSMIFPIITFGGGIAAFAYAIYRIVTDPMKRQEFEERKEKIRVEGNSPEFKEEFTFGEMGEQKEYYFRFCGKMNQSHVMETPERTPIMEAKLLKFKLLSECDYEFINHLTGYSKVHKIGKTMSNEHNNIKTSAWFDFDGENVWDFIHVNGISVEPEVMSKFMDVRFIVKVQGKEIGIVRTSGTAIVPGVKANKLTEKLVAAGLYKIYCSEENVPVLFLVAFALARSDNFICY